MKRLRLLLATLLAIVGATTGWAQDNYGISIGGVDVTSANYTNIKASNGFTAVKSGKVTFDPTANTLTLNNATIQSDEAYGIYVQKDALTIFLIGENTISASSKSAVAVTRAATITGSGSLTLTSESDCGIYISGSNSRTATLTIKDCTISAEGVWGISGRTAGCNLIVDGANVSAKGTSGSICDLASLTLNNSSITSPSGASWDNSKHAVCNTSGTPITNDWVKITSTVKLYAIYTNSNDMLVFYYDDQFNNREYTYKWAFPLDGSNPDWKNSTLIKKVNFHASFANYHSLTNLSKLFSGCSNLAEFYNLQNLNTENVTDMSQMFDGCKMESIDLSHFNTSKVETMNSMFYNCSALTSLNVNSFDTQNVTDMDYMFRGCTNLTTIYCDNDWNKTGLTSSFMFTSCTKLPNFDSSKTDATMANPTTGYFKAKEAYAVKSNNKLTFYYDNERVNRDGTKYDMPTNTIPAWTTLNDAVTDITSVDFDESFDNYHGLTSTFSMFRWLTNLTTIDHLERLHTENVTQMHAMFYRCHNLQYLNLAHLNTSNVTAMDDMFGYCRSMSDIVFGGVTNFDTGKVKSMEGMFAHCEGLTSIDVNNFDVGNVTNMASMFSECTNLETILCDNDWNTPKVTNSANMFYGCDKLASGSSGMSYDPRYLTVDYANPTTGYFQTKAPYAVLSGSTLTFRYDQDMTVSDPNYFAVPLDGSTPGWANNEAITTVNFDNSFDQYNGLTSTKNMFKGLSNLTTIKNISRLHTENVTNMYSMFDGCSSLTSLDLSSFNTGNVTIMSSMFYGCSRLTSLNLSGFNTENVTMMNSMFYGCNGLTSLNLSGWNTAKVTNMAGMFRDCSSLTYLDLSSFNTANVTKMSYMFNNCSNLVTIYVGMEWSIAGLTDSGNNMFLGCTSLVGGLGTTYDANHVDAAYAHNDAGSVLPGYLSWASAYAVLSTDSKTLSFYYDKLKETREGTKYSLRWTSTELPGWTDASNGNQTITTVNIDPSMADYHALKIAKGMFFNLGLLRTINGLEYLDTRNVTDMSFMFTLCQGLTTLDLTHFNVGKVTDMHDMFFYCTNLKTIYCNDNWKSNVVTNSDDMFTDCSRLVGAISYDGNKTNVDYANPNDGYFTNLEAYAAYTADNTTLTFYYDNLRNTRGTTYLLNTGSNQPGWRSDGTYSSVTNVVFDASFADARPSTTNSWFSNMENLTSITGMEYLNTSEVTNMGHMFYNCSSLTSLDLSHFNTANVTYMGAMFYNCSSLPTLDLSSFITGQVTDMGYMFSHCSSLTSLDLSHFNTANVTDMGFMFSHCSSLTSLDLSSFNTANVTNMECMFYECKSLTSLDLSSFNTANVTNMKCMFYVCNRLTTIYVGTGWNTEAVTNSSSMFYVCTRIVGGKGTTFDSGHIDKEYARIDGGPDNPGYFTDKNALPELEAYAVYTADNTTLTFYYDKLRSTRGTTYNYDLNTSGDPAWRSEGISPSVTNVVFDPSFADALPTTTSNWFCDMLNLESITGFEYLNTSAVTEMTQMFAGCSKLTSLDLSGWDVENVSGVTGMFAFCSSLQTIDLTGWKTTNLVSTAQMFFSCNSLTTVYVSDDWTTERITNSSDMFDGCSSIRGGNGTVYDANVVDKTYARIDAAGTPGYFTNKASTIPEPEVEAYAEYTASNTTLTFYYDNLRGTRTGSTYLLETPSPNWTPGWITDGTKASITHVVFDSSFADARPTSTHNWFYYMENLEDITNIEYLNTSEVTQMDYMFHHCSKLTTLDVSHFKTQKVTTMNNMFSDCSSLTSILFSKPGYIYSNSIGENVIDMRNMFSGCSSLTSLDLSRLDTKNVNNMNSMFRGCSSLTNINLGNFDTGKVTLMSGMFAECSSLTSLDLSSFDTENVTDMSHMFSNCRELTSLDLSSFNTANVTDMTYMFASCWDLASLDVSSFNTENVTDMRSMFAGCTLLTSLDVSSFNTEKVTNMHGMFYFCSSLPPLDVSSFNTANVTDMGSMFGQCDRLTTLDLSSFNTAKVTDMSNMFYGCYALTTICVGTGWNTDAVSTSEYMFYRCSNLVGGKGTTYDENHIDKDYARIDGGPDNPGYLTGAPYLVLNGTTLTFYDDGDNNKEGTVYNLRDWSVRAEGVGDDVTTVVFDPSFADARPIYTVAWFYNMANLTTITGMENLNTSEVTAMTGMFANCTSLTTLDLSSFNTANVENMVAMFNGCTSLTTIYAGDGWTTDKVAPAYGSAMFTNCTALVGGNGTAYATAGMVDISFARIDGGPESETPGYFTYKAAFKLGDVNGDGTVSIADVTAVVSYILSNGHPTGTFNIDAANADGIEGITISDAMAIVNLILNK